MPDSPDGWEPLDSPDSPPDEPTPAPPSPAPEPPEGGISGWEPISDTPTPSRAAPAPPVREDGFASAPDPSQNAAPRSEGGWEPILPADEGTGDADRGYSAGGPSNDDAYNTTIDTLVQLGEMTPQEADYRKWSRSNGGVDILSVTPQREVDFADDGSYRARAGDVVGAPPLEPPTQEAWDANIGRYDQDLVRRTEQFEADPRAQRGDVYYGDDERMRPIDERTPPPDALERFRDTLFGANTETGNPLADLATNTVGRAAGGLFNALGIPQELNERRLSAEDVLQERGAAGVNLDPIAYIRDMARAKAAEPGTPEWLRNYLTTASTVSELLPNPLNGPLAQMMGTNVRFATPEQRASAYRDAQLRDPASMRGLDPNSLGGAGFNLLRAVNTDPLTVPGLIPVGEAAAFLRVARTPQAVKAGEALYQAASTGSAKIPPLKNFFERSIDGLNTAQAFPLKVLTLDFEKVPIVGFSVPQWAKLSQTGAGLGFLAAPLVINTKNPIGDYWRGQMKDGLLADIAHHDPAAANMLATVGTAFIAGLGTAAAFRVGGLGGAGLARLFPSSLTTTVNFVRNTRTVVNAKGQTVRVLAEGAPYTLKPGESLAYAGTTSRGARTLDATARAGQLAHAAEDVNQFARNLGELGVNVKDINAFGKNALIRVVEHDQFRNVGELEAALAGTKYESAVTNENYVKGDRTQGAKTFGVERLVDVPAGMLGEQDVAGANVIVRTIRDKMREDGTPVTPENIKAYLEGKYAAKSSDAANLLQSISDEASFRLAQDFSLGRPELINSLFTFRHAVSEFNSRPALMDKVLATGDARLKEWLNPNSDTGYKALIAEAKSIDTLNAIGQEAFLTKMDKVNGTIISALKKAGVDQKTITAYDYRLTQPKVNLVMDAMSDFKGFLSPFWLTMRPQYYVNNMVGNIVSIFATTGLWGPVEIVRKGLYLEQGRRDLINNLAGDAKAYERLKPSWVGGNQPSEISHRSNQPGVLEWLTRKMPRAMTATPRAIGGTLGLPGKAITAGAERGLNTPFTHALSEGYWRELAWALHATDQAKTKMYEQAYTQAVAKGGASPAEAAAAARAWMNLTASGAWSPTNVDHWIGKLNWERLYGKEADFYRNNAVDKTPQQFLDWVKDHHDDKIKNFQQGASPVQVGLAQWTRDQLRQQAIDAYAPAGSVPTTLSRVTEWVDAAFAVADARAQVWADRQNAAGHGPFAPEDYYTDRFSSIVRENKRTAADRRANGATEFLQNNQALIRLFDTADASTLVHEFSHVFRRDLEDFELRAFERELKVTGGVWDVNAEERFARGFEMYVKSGQAPTSALQQVFDQFKQWLDAIYSAVKAMQKPVPASARAWFDEILTGNVPAAAGNVTPITPAAAAAAASVPHAAQNPSVARRPGPAAGRTAVPPVTPVQPVAPVTPVAPALGITGTALGRNMGASITAGLRTLWVDSVARTGKLPIGDNLGAAWDAVVARGHAPTADNVNKFFDAVNAGYAAGRGAADPNAAMRSAIGTAFPNVTQVALATPSGIRLNPGEPARDFQVHRNIMDWHTWYRQPGPELVELYHASTDRRNLVTTGRFDDARSGTGIGRTKGERPGTVFLTPDLRDAQGYVGMYEQSRAAGANYADPGVTVVTVRRGAGSGEGFEVLVRPEDVVAIRPLALQAAPPPGRKITPQAPPRTKPAPQAAVAAAAAKLGLTPQELAARKRAQYDELKHGAELLDQILDGKLQYRDPATGKPAISTSDWAAVKRAAIPIIKADPTIWANPAFPPELKSGWTNRLIVMNEPELRAYIDDMAAKAEDAAANGRPFDYINQQVFMANRELRLRFAESNPDILYQAAPRALPPLDDNYSKPLSFYTNRIYRTVNPMDVRGYLPNGESYGITEGRELFFANTPDLALGQGQNRGGILLEFTPERIQGQVALNKPSARFAYDQGLAEFTVRHATDEDITSSLVSVTVPATVRLGAMASAIERGLPGWVKTVGDDGGTVYRRPEPRAVQQQQPEPARSTQQIQQDIDRVTVAIEDELAAGRTHADMPELYDRLNTHVEELKRAQADAPHLFDDDIADLILEQYGMAQGNTGHLPSNLRILEDAARKAILATEGAVNGLPAQSAPTGGINRWLDDADLRGIQKSAWTQGSQAGELAAKNTFFSYTDRNYFQYLLDHFTPYSYWYMQHIAQLGKSFAKNPAEYAMFIYMANKWMEDPDDKAPGSRWNAKLMTLPDGRQVWFRPQVLSPMAGGTLLDIVDPDDELYKEKVSPWLQWSDALGVNLHLPIQLFADWQQTQGNHNPFAKDTLNSFRGEDVLSFNSLIRKMSGGTIDIERKLREVIYGTGELHSENRATAVEFFRRIETERDPAKQKELARTAKQAILDHKEGKPNKDWDDARAVALRGDGFLPFGGLAGSAFLRYMGAPLIDRSAEDEKYRTLMSSLFGGYGEEKKQPGGTAMGEFFKNHPSASVVGAAGEYKTPQQLRKDMATEEYYAKLEEITQRFTLDQQRISRDWLENGTITGANWRSQDKYLSEQKNAEMKALKADVFAKYGVTGLNSGSDSDADKGFTAGGPGVTSLRPTGDPLDLADAWDKYNGLRSGEYSKDEPDFKALAAKEASFFKEMDKKVIFIDGKATTYSDAIRGLIDKNKTPADALYEREIIPVFIKLGEIPKYKDNPSPEEAARRDKMLNAYRDARYVDGKDLGPQAGANGVIKAGFSMLQYDATQKAKNDARDKFYDSKEWKTLQEKYYGEKVAPNEKSTPTKGTPTGMTASGRTTGSATGRSNVRITGNLSDTDGKSKLDNDSFWAKYDALRDDGKSAEAQYLRALNWDALRAAGYKLTGEKPDVNQAKLKWDRSLLYDQMPDKGPARDQWLAKDGNAKKINDLNQALGEKRIWPETTPAQLAAKDERSKIYNYADTLSGKARTDYLNANRTRLDSLARIIDPTGKTATAPTASSTARPATGGAPRGGGGGGGGGGGARPSSPAKSSGGLETSFFATDAGPELMTVLRGWKSGQVVLSDTVKALLRKLRARYPFDIPANQAEEVWLAALYGKIA